MDITQNFFVGFVSVFIAIIGFALSILGSIIDQLFSSSRQPSPLIEREDVISAQRKRIRPSSQSTNSVTTHHESESTSSCSDSSTTMSPSPHTTEFAEDSVTSDANSPAILVTSDHERSPKHGIRCLSRERKQGFQDAISDTGVDITVRKSSSSRHFFKSKDLRKTPSAPSEIVSSPRLPSPTRQKCVEKKKSQPIRLRTQPYEAPYFFPTPDSVVPVDYSSSQQRKPARSQTLPPERRNPPIPQLSPELSPPVTNALHRPATMSAPRSPRSEGRH